MTENLWLMHVLAISSLEKKKHPNNNNKKFCNYFTIESVCENHWSSHTTDLHSRAVGLSPASISFAQQLGALGQLCCQTTRAPLLCGCDTGFSHLPNPMSKQFGSKERCCCLDIKTQFSPLKQTTT